MKKKGICLVLVMMLMLVMVGTTALAGNRPGSVVSTNVLQLLAGGINLQYEKVLNPGMSFYVSPAVALATGATGFGATAGINGLVELVSKCLLHQDLMATSKFCRFSRSLCL